MPERDALLLERASREYPKDGTVLDHLGRLLGYYSFPGNVGEHGLCKIMEGDWNDSVNRAMARGLIDPTMPWAKMKAVEALVQPYATTDEALEKARAGLEEAPEDHGKQAGSLFEEIDERLQAALDAIDGSESLDDETIVDSMMIPMCLEAVRCLEDGIAASATDVDLALVYGIGFPPFRGGALHYIDDFGVADFVARADELAATAGRLKAMYLPTEKLREMAANGDAFFA